MQLGAGQLLVAVAAGVVSGLYIFGPYFRSQYTSSSVASTSHHTRTQGGSDEEVNPKSKAHVPEDTSGNTSAESSK